MKVSIARVPIFLLLLTFFANSGLSTKGGNQPNKRDPQQSLQLEKPPMCQRCCCAIAYAACPRPCKSRKMKRVNRLKIEEARRLLYKMLLHMQIGGRAASVYRQRIQKMQDGAMPPYVVIRFCELMCESPKKTEAK